MDEEGLAGSPSHPAGDVEAADSSLEKTLKVLVVDDDEATARMIRILLKRAFASEAEIALDCASAAELFASNKYDLVTLDYQLPDGDGLGLLQEFKKAKDSPPVILVTGRGDEHVAASAFMLGASGYVIKDLRLNTMLAAAVHKAVTEIALKKAEAAVQESEARLRNVMDTTLEGIVAIDAEFKLTYANQALAEMLGYESPDEIIGLTIFDFYFDEDLPNIARLLESEMTGKGIIELRNRRADGSEFWALTAFNFTEDEKGEFESAFAMLVDITERKLAEEALKVEKDRVQLYFDITGVMLTVIDTEGKITLINKKGQRLLGYEERELLGRNWYEFAPERTREEILSLFHRVLSGELEIEDYFEHPIVNRSGEEKMIAWHNALLRDDDGNITGVVCSGEDATEMSKAQADLREAAARAETLSRLSKELVQTGLDYEATLRVIARNVANLIGDGCFISLISEDGKHLEASAVEHVNPEARELVKSIIPSYRLRLADDPVANALSTAESQLIPEVDQDELRAQVSHEFFPYIERFGIHSIIVVPLRVKGEPIGTVTILRDEPGEPYTEEDLLLMEEIAFFAATTIDSSRTHSQLQDELTIIEQDQKELEAVNAELEGFAHTVSHDLQGPISAINLGLSQLKDELRVSDIDWSTEKLDSLIEPLQSKISTCSALVTSLLELAESGPVPQDVSTVEVGDIVRKCIEENAAAIQERNVEVEVDPEMGHVVANPTHVYQLFSNLIGNAITHNKASRPRLEVRHLGDSLEGAHRYFIRDNGAGIPENYLGKLFTPFFRAEGGGTVLGLAIVCKVVEAYGGEIKAFNDSGACFDFTIKDFQAV
jgi:PAS domain S-box-containing protein